jgi:hypothetical protein
LLVRSEVQALVACQDLALALVMQVLGYLYDRELRLAFFSVFDICWI